MDITPAKKLNCLGLYCPEPVFRTRMVLDEMEVGQILEVVADDPAAEEDIRRLAENLGHKILDVSRSGNEVQILIKKMK